VLTPVLVAIAIGIRLSDPGPVFFRQPRVGHEGRTFRVWKFRTMDVDAEERKASLKELELNETDGMLFKIKEDPRIFKFGKKLRASSLDELPQLINVLKGEMSLVGPRPPLPYEVATYKRWHRRRLLEARPGVTGLWQVTGRSRTTFEDMVRLDLRYAKNPSVLTDLKILLATPRAVVTGKGAH
jgi:lipopolysaccharide/colanic/teichoic acid biosynthesis glycosyltransferase